MLTGPRHFFLFWPTAELLRFYSTPGDVEDWLKKELGTSVDFEVVGLPSYQWQLVCEGFVSQDPLVLVVALQVESVAALETFTAALKERSAKLQPLIFGNRLVHGADLPVSAADHWCLGDAERPLFGTRRTARDLIGAQGIADLNGAGVNVVMVDRGINRHTPKHYGGGWGTPGGKLPGTTPVGGHGTMVLRNVLNLAPQTRIWDLPLLPPRIIDLDHFLSDGFAAFLQVLVDIPILSGAFPGPWVLCNAWSVYDRNREKPEGHYTDSSFHPFNALIGLMDFFKREMVFAAGNCGQFCPDQRCGIRDRGPGQSILGANSHSRVLTVGAVRADGLWLGYSSEGPGRLSASKPDVCAPSEFSEDTDAFERNGGTSAACGLVVGTIAALRSNPAWKTIPPQLMRQKIRDSASHASAFDYRTGYGIVDAQRLYNRGPYSA